MTFECKMLLQLFFTDKRVIWVLIDDAIFFRQRINPSFHGRIPHLKDEFLVQRC